MVVWYDTIDTPTSMAGTSDSTSRSIVKMEWEGERASDVTAEMTRYCRFTVY